LTARRKCGVLKKKRIGLASLWRFRPLYDVSVSGCVKNTIIWPNGQLMVFFCVVGEALCRIKDNFAHAQMTSYLLEVLLRPVAPHPQ
jgi:hypothetical protein